MSMTPLTDAQLVRVYGKTGEMCAATPTCGHPTYVPADFARALERIAAERDEYARWRKVLADKLDEVERQRDALAVALNKRENDLMATHNTLVKLVAACERLSAESEEYEFDDGMGRGVLQSYWDEFEDALEKARDRIGDAE